MASKLNATSEKSAGQQLSEKLMYKRKNAWEQFSSPADRKTIFAFAEEYKDFISVNKTERLCISSGIDLLQKAGFQEIGKAKQLKTNSFKVFTSAHGKNLAAFVAGKQPVTEGINFVLSHVDCPRLDLKPQPLYEESQLALLKTHYYGGIKKYQWVAIPLALYGTAYTQDAKEVSIAIGDGENDPILMITDLLPHLGRKQMAKPLREAISSEELNVFTGSIPFNDNGVKDRVKLAILEYIYNNYGLIEEDLITAEFQLVPSGRAHDLGFDRSFIAGYGHDDRSCSYAAMQSLIYAEKPEKTSMIMWIDKEEIGSDGITSAQGQFLETAISELLVKLGLPADSQTIASIFRKSSAISADVDAVYDPTYKAAFDLQNTPYINNGVSFSKYTGHGGKYSASEAEAGFFAKIVKIFNDEKIPWQTGELGKVDEGGGGTIAKYIAKRGINIIDCGVGVLSMHAPWEVISKVDLYVTYLAYRAFMEKM